MAIDLEKSGSALYVKNGAAVGTPLHGTFKAFKGENCILFESKQLSYYLRWDNDGDDLINLRRELVNGEYPEQIENAAYFSHTENALTLIGGAMLDEKIFDSADIKLNGSAVDIKMTHGDQSVSFSADYNDSTNILSDMSTAVNGKRLELSKDGSVTLKQKEDLLLCEGGDVFSDLPDRIHIASDNEVHFTYGNETWVYTWDSTDGSIKNAKKHKL